MTTRLAAGFAGPIASAVVAEINRITDHPGYQPAEGVAYKAAWDRAGSDFNRHCDAFRRDCLIASFVAMTDGRGALHLALGRARLSSAGRS